MGIYNHLQKKAISKTIKNDNNCLFLFVGDTGSGKSTAAINTGLLVDPDFSVDRIFFKPLSFMEALESGLDRGSVLMFDEAGEAVDSRKWYSDPNDVITSVVDTFRDDNLVMLWATPALDRIDTRVRDMFDEVLVCIEPGKIQAKVPRKDLLSGSRFFYYPKVSDNGFSKRRKLVNPNTEHHHNVTIPKVQDWEEKAGKKGLWERYMKKKRKFIKEEIYGKGKKQLQENTDENFDSQDILKELVNFEDDFNLHEDLTKKERQSIVNMKIRKKYPEKDFAKSDIQEALAVFEHEYEWAKQQYTGEINVKCHHCGYEWNYTGNLDETNCPKCHYKVKTKP